MQQLDIQDQFKLLQASKASKALKAAVFLHVSFANV